LEEAAQNLTFSVKGDLGVPKTDAKNTIRA
jgi:hypothetical protein